MVQCQEKNLLPFLPIVYPLEVLLELHDISLCQCLHLADSLLKVWRGLFLRSALWFWRLPRPINLAVCAPLLPSLQPISILLAPLLQLFLSPCHPILLHCSRGCMSHLIKVFLPCLLLICSYSCLEPLCSIDPLAAILHIPHHMGLLLALPIGIKPLL